MTSTDTLSMGQIARLADVRRPVVTIWRQRPVPGKPFPPEDSEGRFRTDEVLDWLEATGRGKNRHARVDLTLANVLSPQTPTEQLENLLALVAARCLMGRPLAGLDPDEVLDVVEEADGDDEWLWSEAEHADFTLAGVADLAVAASWAPADAHDRILQTLQARQPAHKPLVDETVSLLADVARHCVAPLGAVVDVAGSATDAILQLLRDEDLPEIGVVVPGEGPDARMARQRLRIRNLPVRSPELAEDWALPGGSVMTLRLPAASDEAWSLMDQTTMQLGPNTVCLVLGTPDLLLGPLEREASTIRARVMGADLLRATVTLPHQRRNGSEVTEQTLWVLAPAASGLDDLQALVDAKKRGRKPTPAAARPAAAVISTSFADLTTAPRTTQALVLDLAAAADDDSRHRMRLLRTVQLRVPEPGSRVQMARGPFSDTLHALSDEDAARINDVLTRLAEPLPDALLKHPANADKRHVPSLVTVGDALARNLVRVRSGKRGAADIPRGGEGFVWTAASLTLGRPEQVDLPQLLALTGRGGRTKPGDVVFSSSAKPSAVVDTQGGAVVGFPLRVLRIKPDAELSPAGIAAAINDLPPNSGAWKEWQLPVATYRARADDFLSLLDDYVQQLNSRKNAVDDLRRLVARSVLTGAVKLD